MFQILSRWFCETAGFYNSLQQKLTYVANALLITKLRIFLDGETKKMYLSSGNHLIMKNIDFKKGQYFVVVENELGEIITSQKLTVTN